MRETFNNIWHLMGYYEYLKFHVASIPTILPKPDFGEGEHHCRARMQQSTMEDMFIFIGDVEMFVKWFYKNGQQSQYIIIPEECLMKIFTTKFCRHMKQFKSWAHLARHFHDRIAAKKEKLPRRLRYREHLCDIGRIMENSSEQYFRKRAFIVCEEETVTNL